MEESQLHIVDLKSKDMLRKIENGIVYGLPVLLQDVLEELDPALEPVLAKALIKVGNREVLRLGDKELDYNKENIDTVLINSNFTCNYFIDRDKLSSLLKYKYKLHVNYVYHSVFLSKAPM